MRWLRCLARLVVVVAVAVTGVGCWPGVANLTYKTAQGQTRVYNDGQLLAVYNQAGNTFIEFWFAGVNVLGGFSSGTPGSNAGGASKGHSSDYPFGWQDGFGGKPQWEGFWAGFNYMDQRWKYWQGVAGNPFAQQSFKITQPSSGLVQLHVVTKVGPANDPLFQCEVDYFIRPSGIGVKNVVTVLRELQPIGYDDTGGQLMMTQIDCDLDPGQPYDQSHQPDLYYKLALNGNIVNIDPFPPTGGYNTITPSNIYADQNIPAPAEKRVNPLPNTALVPSGESIAFISPMQRPGRNVNVALRIDLVRSTLPELEYYCEYNGERDYLNYLFSPAIGLNRTVQTVAQGTKWVVYGDMVVWAGNDPSVLSIIPMLSQ